MLDWPKGSAASATPLPGSPGLGVSGAQPELKKEALDLLFHLKKEVEREEEVQGHKRILSADDE